MLIFHSDRQRPNGQRPRPRPAPDAAAVLLLFKGVPGPQLEVVPPEIESQASAFQYRPMQCVRWHQAPHQRRRHRQLHLQDAAGERTGDRGGVQRKGVHTAP